MSVTTDAAVTQIRDKDDDLFLNLDNGWKWVGVHSHTANGIAAVLRDGHAVTFGMFASRDKLVDYANLTGLAIEWDSEEGAQ